MLFTLMAHKAGRVDSLDAEQGAVVIGQGHTGGRAIRVGHGKGHR